jgi:Kiwa KwaB-like protein
MATQASTVLKRVRKADFKNCETNLWLIKRRLSGKEAVYTALRVETDSKLKQRLKGAITRKILAKNLVLEEYDFLTADQDDRIFTLDSSETDFVKIHEQIKKGLANPKATKYEELLNSWAFVIELKKGEQAIYGMRKVSALTQAKKVASLSSFLFQNSLLVDLSDKQVFTLDLNIDFFVFEGLAFITHKKDFESVLNFRKGMEDNRDAVLDEFTTLGVFSDTEPMREYIGVNLHHLRKISAIRKSAYYKDKKFMAALVQVNKDEKWGLLLSDGKITVTEENAETVLTLLSNSRLRSPINQEVFDALVKKKVG